jgi:hypothetical protein
MFSLVIRIRSSEGRLSTGEGGYAAALGPREVPQSSLPNLSGLTWRVKGTEEHRRQKCTLTLLATSFSGPDGKALGMDYGYCGGRNEGNPLFCYIHVITGGFDCN